jgi:anti-sigma factor RsiW
VLDEPVPERLRRVARYGQHRYQLAAGLVGLGISLGAASGWFAYGALHGVPSADSASLGFARQAAIAHAVFSPELSHAVEVGADQEDHLEKWLSRRLGTALKCPKLGPLGYQLVGGRLLSGPDGPVADFMYQDGKGGRLTLYVARQPGEARQTAFHFTQEDKVAVLYWMDGKYGYALSSETGHDSLQRVGEVVYKQLNP